MSELVHALTPDQHERIAARHEEARIAVQPIKRVTATHPQMTIDDAYACQSAWVQQQVEGGARIVGHLSLIHI